MKRRNLILKNTVLLVISSILFLSFLHSIDRQYFSNSIGASFFQSVEETLVGTKRAVYSNELWENSGQVDELAIPNDLSVLYVHTNGVNELNPNLSSREFSDYLQNEFLPSESGKDLISSKQKYVGPVSLSGQSNDFRSMYALVEYIDTENAVLLLAKDISVWDWYLLNTRIFYIIVILVFLITVFYFYFIQQRRVYNHVLGLTEAAYRFSENDFSSKMVVKSNDEIGDLATAITKLGKTLETTSLMNHKEKTLLEHVFDSLSVGIIYADENSKVTSLNKVGMHYYSTYVRENDDSIQDKMKEMYEKAVQHCFETGSGHRMEVQQTQMIFDVRFSPVMEETGRITGVLLMIEEVTNAKRLAAIREDLITNVSHDFRTPLSMIIGYSEAIVDDLAESIEEKNEMARIIHDEASQLNQMINSLLNLSRLKAGHMELDYQVVKVKTFFQRILKRFSETLIKENITFTLEIEEELEFIQVDEERMHHAVYNLIDNAIRYSADPESRDKRYIKVEVKLDQLLDQVLIVVSDNGIGISEASIPFIFERFYKDDKARTRPNSNGSGIGLSLVYSIIDKHEGSIDVESAQGEGSSFTIRLPYQQTNYGNLEEISN